MIRQEVPFTDLVAQHRGLRDELMRVFAATLDTATFTGGHELASFEEEFARYVGCRHAVAVANGTDALRLALMAMGIGRGDTVVTVPNTFIATTEAISQVGARFELVDIEPRTCLMDPNRLEDHLQRAFAAPSRQPRPTAVLPVHLYGQCADMDAIGELSKRYGLKVLEDAAQAHGATYRGRKAGSFGSAAAFSFYPAKNLGACGEAGAVTTNDAGIAERVRELRDHGQRTKYYHAVEGYNARMDSVQSGLLRVKLRRLDSWNAARRQWAEVYDAAFAASAWIRPVVVREGNVSCVHLYVIHVENRHAVQEHLARLGVATGLHYPVPLHLQECYAGLGLTEGTFPHAERSAAQLLSLPMFAELGEDRARYVADAVLSFAARS